MATKTIAKTKTRLNMRSGPSTKFEVIKVLPQLAVGEVLDYVGEWIKVRVGSQDGYIHANYVIMETVETAPAAAAAPAVQKPQQPEVSAEHADDHHGGQAPAQKMRGKTKTRLNMRQGAGTAYKVIKILASNTPFDVVDQHDSWLHVKTSDGMEGYLHVNYVTLEVVEVETVTAPKDDGKKEVVKENPIAVEAPAVPGPMDDVPLALPEDQHLPVDPKAPLLERLVSDAWNRYGSLLKALAAQLEIDPAVAVAVLAVESGGRGFADDGRMMIRFENHVFWDYWGKNNARVFNAHFKYDPNARWLGHQFRAEERGDRWVTMHVRSQDIEWQVFEFASRLNGTAARMSISMGGPQIMGFNYPIIGFDNVHAMFDAFNASERNQVIAFFDFVKGRTTPSRRLDALQKLDFVEFARLYNGSGQAKKYGGLINDVYDIFHKLTDSA